MPAFSVTATTHFERETRKLVRRHPDLPDELERVATILSQDPYNRTRSHQIKKLESVAPGDGQYRIRFGRFRVRYDIEGQTVFLKYCGLRREDTY